MFKKKFLYTVIILLVTFSSCYQLDDELQGFETEASVTRCVSVKTNVEAEMMLSGQYRKGSDVVFDIDDTEGNAVELQVNAPGYITQKALIGFGQNNAAGIDLQLVREAYGESTSVLYTPNLVIGQEITINSHLSVPILSVSTFPVGIEPEESEIEAILDDYSSFDVSYSNGCIIMRAEVIGVSEGTEQSGGSMNTYMGSYVIPFKHKTGYESIPSAHPVITQFLGCCFGTPVRELQRNATYKAETSSRIDYTVVQSYADYTFKSGNTTFTARVYQTVRVNVKGEYIDEEDYVYGGSGETSGL